MTDPLPGRDLRVCIFGDSFVAGVGDPACQGWVGRIAARAFPAVGGLTVYNLGVRRDTSADVRARFLAEARTRLPADVDGRVVFSFGVNDCAVSDGAMRVSAETAVANLAALIAESRWPVLVVGPPPIADPGQNDRIAALDKRFCIICRDAGVPYTTAFGALHRSPRWMSEVRSGDGSHPAAGGYSELAQLVWDSGWLPWLATVAH